MKKATTTTKTVKTNAPITKKEYEETLARMKRTKNPLVTDGLIIFMYHLQQARKKAAAKKTMA